MKVKRVGDSLRLAVVLLLATFASRAVPQQPRADRYRRVAEVSFDWDGHPGVRFLFDKSDRREGPGDFERLRIDVPGHAEAEFSSSDAWVRVSSDFGPLDKRIFRKNAISSDYVYGLARGHGNLSVLLFLTAYGCCVGGVDVIELDSSGTPRLVLHKARFAVTAIRDLDGDGRPELVGIPALAEQFGDCLMSYDPRLVYHLGGRPGEPASLSLPLARKYNVAYYYGWAGPDYSDSAHVIVLHPKGGERPVITDETSAEKLADPAKCPN